jgi:hypothetical protein
MNCILIIGKKKKKQKSNKIMKKKNLPLVTWHTCNVTNGTHFFFFLEFHFFLHLVCIFFFFWLQFISITWTLVL